MHYLITGGLGFIGSNFIRHLLTNDKDTQITNIDIISHGANPANLKDIDKQKNYKFLKGDIRSKETLKKHLEYTDVIVNFAAESHVDRSISDPWPFFKSNTEGVLNILELIRQTNKNIKFLQIGTDESYGDITEGTFEEEDKLKPSSPYAASKASADLFCLAYHRTYGLDMILTRCTNNFGPFQFPEKLIPKTIIRAHHDLKIPIYGSGKNVRDWIYVIDHCEAVKTVIEKGKSGEIYNISSGNELENIKVVETILNFMDKPSDLMEFVEDRPGHDIRYSLDSSKIKEKLGWAPKHLFIEAIKETVNWYNNNKQWWSSLVNPQVIHPTPWKLKW
ncbi:dTDP-glucose 4,6-dehydratase [Candidatus Bathyarchaeota archaeon RBG_13_38_9]|nr:MAG: dTDP-glucose 4,6-dehydratase [Candidatus Bathyarchaeota archaeon RBG_13_38_9]